MSLIQLGNFFVIVSVEVDPNELLTCPAGGIFGTLITTTTVGYISSLSIGWPITFYGHGLIGLAWVASWWYNGATTPAEHHYISEVEIEYIENSIGLEKNDRPKVIFSKHILR